MLEEGFIKHNSLFISAKEEDFMISSNNKEHIGIAYVCYLDILGFKKDICNNWGKNPDLLDKILSIKKELMKFNVKGKDDLEYSDPGRYFPKVITMSDSFIFCYMFTYENYRKTFDPIIGLQNILPAISCCWLAAIKNGYTIRGAIDIGEVYLDENDLIGPAFINAYKLESEVAKNSRIIISSEMNKLFCELANRNEDLFHATMSKYLRKDVDGYTLVIG